VTEELHWRSRTAFLKKLSPSNPFDAKAMTESEMRGVVSKKFVRGDWKFADSFSRGVIDCVDDGGTRSSDSDFTDTPHT
jgi:hypothetical protein